MRFQCVNCDLSFDVDGGKPRCPRCRKTTGLELRPEPAPPARRFQGPLALIALVAAVGGGYLWWAERAPAGVPSEVPSRPLESDELRAYARDRGVTSKRPPDPLQTSPELEKFARAAARGASGRQALSGVYEALAKRGAAGDYRSYLSNEPRDTDVRTASRAFASIQTKRGDRLYSLELAEVLASGARASGADAMLVEVLSYPGERSPVDPSGYMGHFAVALAPAGKPKGPVEVFDLAMRRHQRLPAAQVVVLDDVAVLGHFFNHQGLFKLGQASDAASALEKVEQALQLAPGAAPILGTRGAILLASGGVQEGIKGLERALHTRRDSARHHNLGAAYLVSSDPERAARELGQALADSPDYAAAHASMGALHIARGEAGEAEEELQTAERLDPELASLPMLWANLLVARHRPDEAVQKAQEAVRRRPSDDRARLMLASLYHELGRIGDMTRELRTVLSRARQPDEMKDLIRANFGVAALEAAEEPEEPGAGADVPGAEAEAAEAAADADGGSGFQLGSKVLGTGGEGAGSHGLRLGEGGLRLGGSSGGGGGGGLKLRLGEP